MSDEALNQAADAGANDGAAPTEEIAQDPLFDKLAETVTGIVGDAPPPPAAEGPAKPEEAKAEDGEEEQAEVDDWDDLGDDKPWTAERHKKVAEQHRNDRRKLSAL